MKTGLSKTLAVVAMCAMLAGLTISAQAEEDTLTQGDVATALVQKLGISKNLPLRYTDATAIDALRANSISPFGGWDAARKLKVGDFAKIMVESLGWSGRIPLEQQGQPRSYVALLEDSGIPVDSVSDALAKLRPLATSKDGGVIRQLSSSDPLTRRPILGARDESALGVDFARASSGSLSDASVAAAPAAEPAAVASTPAPSRSTASRSAAPAPASHSPAPASASTAAPAPAVAPEPITRTRFGSRVIRITRPSTPN